MSETEVEAQARYLAKENCEAEPEITQIYWFPDGAEVRLVEVVPTIPPSGGRLLPFYFRPAPDDGLPAATGIAMIRPEEYRQLSLPSDWGGWDDAVELLPGEKNTI